MRTIEQSTALIDEIVGRCVREADFAERVLANYEEALAEYRLNQAELDDFKALKEQFAPQAAAHWAILRKMHAG